MKKKTIKYLALSSCFSVLLNYSLNKDNEFKTILECHNHENKSFDIVAHRGFSSIEPENSKEAVVLANKNVCTDLIEVDVRLTKDDIIVLRHDDDNISNTNYKDMNKIVKDSKTNFFEFLKNYDEMSLTKVTREYFKQTGELITLEETLNIIDKPLIIDIKFDSNEDIFINKLFDITDKSNKKIIFQSSSEEALLRMKKKNSNYKYYQILSTNKDLENINLSFDGYTIKYNIASRNLIEFLDSYKKDILIWTINDKTQLQKILMDIDSINNLKIITDYPDCICVVEKVR